MEKSTLVQFLDEGIGSVLGTHGERSGRVEVGVRKGGRRGGREGTKEGREGSGGRGGRGGRGGKGRGGDGGGKGSFSNSGGGDGVCVEGECASQRHFRERLSSKSAC